MDLKQFDNLAALAADHRRQLEARLKKARGIRKNLERMVEQAIADINHRAEEDKLSVSTLFTTMISNEEATILQLRQELGEERKILRAEMKETAQDVTVEEEPLPDLLPVVKLVGRSPVPVHALVRRGQSNGRGKGA